MREWTGLVVVGGLDSFRSFAVGSWAGDPSRLIAAAATVGDFSTEILPPFFVLFGWSSFARSQSAVSGLSSVAKLPFQNYNLFNFFNFKFDHSFYSKNLYI